MTLSIKKAMQAGQGIVSIRGWVFRERGSNKFRFIILKDVTQKIQCVFDHTKFSDEQWSALDKVQIETSMEITGEIKKEERAPTGFELHATDFTIVGFADTFPLTKDQSVEFLLDKRHLALRTSRMTAILKIRSTVLAAIHDFFREKEYLEFSPPIFTPNACEGGATLFSVKYFDDTVYLTQSWQLYAEAAIFSLEKIYCISPCFRAERSKTSRHLAEFWMAEMEAAWLKLDDVVLIAKEEIKYIIKRVLEKNKNELDFLKRDTHKLQSYVDKEFKTITYTQALKVLKEIANMEVEWGKDLRTVEEDELMKHFDAPVVVVDYPKEIMAFYKPERISKDAPKPVAACFDMIAPEGYGEIIGGSQRETEIKALKKGLEKEGESLEKYDWYFDLRRFGNVPHSGYGVGVERVVAWICGLDNIKDAIPFPRTMFRKSP